MKTERVAAVRAFMQVIHKLTWQGADLRCGFDFGS